MRTQKNKRDILRTVFLIFFTSLGLNLWGQTLSADGSGDSEEAARASAYMRLRAQVVADIDIRSAFSAVLDEGKLGMDFDPDADSSISVVSNLGVLGFTETWGNRSVGSDRYTLRVSAKISDLREVYQRGLRKLDQAIAALTKSLDKAPNLDERDTVSAELLQYLSEFEKYRNMAVLIGAGSLPKQNLSLVELQDRVKRTAGLADSLDRAVSTLAEGLDRSITAAGASIFIEIPVSPGGTGSLISPGVSGGSVLPDAADTLSEVLVKKLAAKIADTKLAVAPRIQVANYVFRGRYDFLTENGGGFAGLELSYVLVGLTGADKDLVKKITSVRLLPGALAGMSY